MKENITNLLNQLSYEWEWKTKNKIVFKGEVWIGEINKALDKEKIKYTWSYEKGEATYYINSGLV